MMEKDARIPLRKHCLRVNFACSCDATSCQCTSPGGKQMMDLVLGFLLSACETFLQFLTPICSGPNLAVVGIWECEPVSQISLFLSISLSLAHTVT